MGLAPFIHAQTYWSEYAISPNERKALHAVEYPSLPQKFRLLSINLPALHNRISVGVNQGECFEVPLPYGGIECFDLEPYSITPYDLQQNRTDIESFRGKSRSNPSHRIHILVTAQDIHIIGDSEEGTFFLDKVQGAGDNVFMSFYGKDEELSELHSCEMYDAQTGQAVEEVETHTPTSSSMRATTNAWGTELRKYRMAIIWTHGHSANYGNDTTLINNRSLEIVTDMNFVCERDLCVTFELAPNPTSLIFTDAASDTYNGLGSATGIINNAIGSSNFEIGMAISGGGGGVSYLGVTCGGSKGGTQSSNSHWVIVHELGHNMGAGHMMNYCPNWGANNMEPGAGNSIMSYGGSGVCGGGHQVPGGRIDYFHSRSIEQMYNKLFINSNCAVNIPTGNTPPTAILPSGGFYIPQGTPFSLTGSATDPDSGTVFSYSWQQFDSGIGSPPWAPTDVDPLFQMLPYDNEPTRTFPRMDRIINGHDYGEVLPTSSRTLSFRFAVRDNHTGGSGVNYGDMAFFVEGTAGPFEVTFPNNGGILGSVGQSKTVTWDVANTDIAPVNCAIVDVLLSTDGGYTYPITLAIGVPNNGATSIVIPNHVGTTNRIMVRAADNVFFDISDEDFEIVDATTNDYIANVEEANQSFCSASSITYTLGLEALGTFNSNVNLTVSGLPTGATASFPAGNSLAITSHTTATIQIDNLGSIATGQHSFDLLVDGGGVSKSYTLGFVKKDNLMTPEPNQAMEFDGTADIHIVRNNTDFDFGDDQNFSIELWTKTTTTSGDDALISNKNWNNGRFKGWVIAIQSGRIVFNVGSGDDRVDISSGGSLFNDGEWHHISVSVDRVGQFGLAKLYVDGVLQEEKGLGGLEDITNSLDIVIGADHNNNYRYEGLIDEVRIWKKALSTQEVRENMHRVLESCEADLISCYQFNETTGNALDAFSHHDGSLNNVIRVVSSAPFGTGVANTQTESSSYTSFISTDLSIDYHDQAGASVTATKINLTPYGTIGIDPQDIVFDSQYWAVNDYDASGGLDMDLTFTVAEDITPTWEANPIALKLYGRFANGDDDWILLGNADSANATANTVTFHHIGAYGQFLLAGTIAPVIAGSPIMDDFCVTTPNQYSGNVLSYTLQGIFLQQDLMIIPPNGFEVSLQPNSGFTSDTLILAQTGGEIDTTTIYVKFLPTTTGLITGTIAHHSDGVNLLDTYVAGVSTPEAADIAGMAMQTTGAGSYINLSDLFWQPTEFTVEFWLKPFSLAAWNQVVGSGWDRFLFHAAPDGSFYTGISVAGGSRIQTAPGVLEIDEWSHIAVSFDNGLLNVYHNGLLVGSQPSAAMPNLWPGDFTIGGADGIDGEIDEFRIWETARSEQEIRENMHLTMEVEQACSEGLLVYYQFDAFVGDTLPDAVGNHIGTIIGTPSLVTAREPVGEGMAESQTETQGNVAFSQTGVEVQYVSEEGASITLSRINTTPYGTIGIDPNDTPLSNQYWVANDYTNNGALTFNASFAVSENLTAQQAAAPISCKLYGRHANSDTTWTLIGNAVQVDDVLNTLSFEDIIEYGQYYITTTTQATVGLSQYDLEFCPMTEGDTSDILSYDLSGVFLSGSVTLTAPHGFLLADSPSGTWAQSLSISPTSGNINAVTVYIRFVPDSIGTFSGNVEHNFGSGSIQLSVLGENYPAFQEIADQALYLDGAGDEVDIANGESIVLQNHTVEMWFRPDWSGNVNGFQTLFAKRNGSGTAISIHVKSSQLAVWNGFASSLVNYSFDPSQWYHIACVFTNSGTNAYINGEQILSNGVGYNQGGNGFPITFGSTNTGAEYFHGYIDELKIWDNERSLSQIRENMHLTVNLKEVCGEGLVAYYQFDDVNGGIVDRVGGRDGTLVGDATLATSDVPAAKGVAVLLPVTTSGTYSFDEGGRDTKLDISFPTQVPNGDIVVSYLTGEGVHGSLPDPNSFTDRYWIVDDYGDGTADCMDATMVFECPPGWVSSMNVEEYGAYKRPSRSLETDKWQFPGLVTDVNPTLNQVTLSNVKSFSQFVLSNQQMEECPTQVNANYALYMDGSQGDEADFQNGNEIDLAGHTVELWFRPDWKSNQSSAKTLFAKRSGGGTGISIHVASDEMVVWNGIAVSVTPYDFLPSQWYHLACVFLDTTTVVYVNGWEVQRGVPYNTNNADAPIALGSNNQGGERFEGYIDELKIWSVERSLDQIREGMHLTIDRSLANCTDGLVVYHQFDDCNGEMRDKLSNYPLTLLGDARFEVSDVPVAEGISVTQSITQTGSYSFDDGTNDTKLDINFPTQSPNGDVVVSYLTGEGFHGTSPSLHTLDSVYWIVNNYGTNNTALDAELTFTAPAAWLSHSTPASYSAFKRRSTAKATNAWQELTSVGSIQQGTGELSLLNVDSFSQFALAKDVPSTCSDGILNGDETDVDCGGSCNPCSTCDYTTIIQEDFESGWGIWSDGGNDARRNIADSTFANSGDYCVRLQDNTGSSNTTTSSLALSEYNELEVSFSYITNGMLNPFHDFFLQISMDNGASYQTIEEWNLTDEFDNDQRWNERIVINGPFTDTTRIRFRCDAGDNSHRMYIDDVTVLGCRTIPLPLDLMNFIGTRMDDKVQLDWTTLNEVATRGFEVERKTAAEDFQMIGWVDSKGGTALNTYQFVDETASFAQTNYYRLKMVDMDGGWVYSNIVEIAPEDIGEYGISLYPNPSQQYINMRIAAPSTEQFQIKIYNDLGALVTKEEARWVDAFSPISVYVGDYPNGVYRLTIVFADGERAVLPFVKLGD